MVVHVDHVEVHEAAARPAGPHAHVQVLHPVGRQRKDASGVRLQKQQRGEWGRGVRHLPPAVTARCSGATWPACGRKGPSENTDLRGPCHSGHSPFPTCLTPRVGQSPPAWRGPLWLSRSCRQEPPGPLSGVPGCTDSGWVSSSQRL